MANDQAPEPATHRFALAAAIAAVAAAVGVLVTLVLGVAVKQHAFWVIATIACVAVLVSWLTALTRAGAAARRGIEELERQAAAECEKLERRAAAQREELDRLQLLVGRVTRATFPDWLLVAIHHTEQTGGRIDIVPTGLRFVSAARDGTWTVALPLSPDPAAQAGDHEGLHHALGIGQLKYTTALIESTR